jgi:hypothetical protein
MSRTLTSDVVTKLQIVRSQRVNCEWMPLIEDDEVRRRYVLT